MKKIFVIFILLAIVLVPLYLLFGIPVRVNTSFATKVLLKQHYNGQKLDVVVTDAKDVKAMRDLFSGWATTTDSASAFYTDYTSVTLTNGRKDIVFYPCFGGDPRINIGGTDKYQQLSDKQKKTLDSILKKYGIVID